MAFRRRSNSEMRVRDIELYYAAYNNDVLKARIAIVLGADVNCKNLEGYTPLCIASKKGNSDVVSLLISKGADPNVATANKFTPLMFAVMNGDMHMVMTLVNYGALTGLKNIGGYDAYELAESHGKENVAKYLKRFHPEHKKRLQEMDLKRGSEALMRLRRNIEG